MYLGHTDVNLKYYFKNLAWKKSSFSISQGKYIMVRSMVMGTSKWVAVPLNAHSIHETRKRYTIQKVIYLGHIKLWQASNLVSGCAANWRFRLGILDSRHMKYFWHSPTQCFGHASKMKEIIWGGTLDMPWNMKLLSQWHTREELLTVAWIPVSITAGQLSSQGSTGFFLTFPYLSHIFLFWTQPSG